MAKYSYIENIVDNGNTNVHCTVHVFFLLENLMFFSVRVNFPYCNNGVKVWKLATEKQLCKQ